MSPAGKVIDVRHTSVLHLARAGIGEIRLDDPDLVEPGTIVRWPLGFQALGLGKAAVLHNLVQEGYPYTSVTSANLRIGDVSADGELQFLKELLSGVDLIYDATAELGVQHFLSDVARELRIPYIGVSSMVAGVAEW